MIEWCFECEERTPWKLMCCGNVKCVKCGTEELWEAELLDVSYQDA